MLLANRKRFDMFKKETQILSVLIVIFIFVSVLAVISIFLRYGKNNTPLLGDKVEVKQIIESTD